MIKIIISLFLIAQGPIAPPDDWWPQPPKGPNGPAQPI